MTGFLAVLLIVVIAEDIPEIPDREERMEEILVDCNGQGEELGASEVYFTDTMEAPFDAIWRDPDDPGHKEVVTVLGEGGVDERRGIWLKVRRGQKERRLLAEQVWAKATQGWNAVILDVTGIGWTR